MIQIRPWLFVGRYRDTKDLALLQASSIGAMLQLAEPVEQPGIASLYLPVEDGGLVEDFYFKQGAKFIRTQKQSGKLILVACGAGQSRSVAFAVAASTKRKGLTCSKHCVRSAPVTQRPGRIQKCGNHCAHAMENRCLYEK